MYEEPDLVGYLVFSFVGCGYLVFLFRYLAPLFYFFSTFNSLASLSVKAAKELLKEGRKEMKIPFKFKLYFWVQ